MTNFLPAAMKLENAHLQWFKIRGIPGGSLSHTGWPHLPGNLHYDFHSSCSTLTHPRNWSNFIIHQHKWINTRLQISWGGRGRRSVFSQHSKTFFNNPLNRGTWLAQSEERVTLDSGVVSSSPTLGVEITLKKKERDLFPSHWLLLVSLTSLISQLLDYQMILPREKPPSENKAPRRRAYPLTLCQMGPESLDRFE